MMVTAHNTLCIRGDSSIESNELRENAQIIVEARGTVECENSISEIN